MEEREIKTRQWRAVYKEFLRSAQSGKKFCSEKGVSYSTFKGWRQRFEMEKAGSFIEVSPPAQESKGTSYAVILKNGREVRASGDFREERILQLIRVCENA